MAASSPSFVKGSNTAAQDVHREEDDGQQRDAAMHLVVEEPRPFRVRDAGHGHQPEADARGQHQLGHGAGAPGREPQHLVEHRSGSSQPACCVCCQSRERIFGPMTTATFASQIAPAQAAGPRASRRRAAPCRPGRPAGRQPAGRQPRLCGVAKDDRGRRRGIRDLTRSGDNRRQSAKGVGRKPGPRIDDVVEGDAVRARPPTNGRRRGRNRAAVDRDHVAGCVTWRGAVLGDEDPPPPSGAHPAVAMSPPRPTRAPTHPRTRRHRARPRRQIGGEAFARGPEVELDAARHPEQPGPLVEPQPRPTGHRLGAQVDRSARCGEQVEVSVVPEHADRSPIVGSTAPPVRRAASATPEGTREQRCRGAYRYRLRH